MVARVIVIRSIESIFAGFSRRLQELFDCGCHTFKLVELTRVKVSAEAPDSVDAGLIDI
jgi:hypothetical protein